MSGVGGVLGRVIVFTLAGVVAGLFTWFISDVSGFVRLSQNIGRLTAPEARDQYVVFLVWGASVAVALGVADALMSGGRAEWLKVIGFGLLVGAVAGVLGGALGMALYSGFYYFGRVQDPLTFVRNVVARAAAWAFIGGLAGTASGWRKLNFRVARNGLVGGLIGGFIGGSVFEAIPYLLPGLNASPVSRLFGFVITGGMIGLFVALVQELLKEAWLRVVVGRNEGKEILVEKEVTRIGRSELSDVPLYGDTTVAKNHAVLVALPGGRFAVRDTGESPSGVLVNESRVTGEQPVRSGDRIQVGGRLLVFYERATRTPTPRAARDVAAPRPASSAAASGLPSLSDLPTVSGRVAPMPVPPTPSAAPAAPRAAAAPVNAGFGAESRLVVVAGPHAGAAFPAAPGRIIGRDGGADIPIPGDSKASRRHARLDAEGRGLAIEDLGSTNGTYVNGRRVERQALVTGDAVVIGNTQFRFE